MRRSLPRQLMCPNDRPTACIAIDVLVQVMFQGMVAYWFLATLCAIGMIVMGGCYSGITPLHGVLLANNFAVVFAWCVRGMVTVTGATSQTLDHCD